MPIEFRCSQCGKLLRTADETAGKQARCPECGAVMQVPAAGEGQPAGPRNPYQSPGDYPPQQPPYVAPGVVRGHVPNYLVQAILCTLFCCVPFGIAAIVFAAQVNAKLAAGDYAGAVRASDNARLWCWVSFGSGLAMIVLYVMLVCAGALAG